MRLVLDTNVLVAALLHPGRTPDRALALALESGATVLVDARIRAEYGEVLARKKFARIEAHRRDTLLARIDASSEVVQPREASTLALIDEDDRVFVDVALAGRADAIVTGNLKHYPATIGIAVLAPAELLARLSEPATPG